MVPRCNHVDEIIQKVRIYSHTIHVMEVKSTAWRLWSIIFMAHLKAAKRVDLKSPHHKKKNCNYVWEWMSTRLSVVIILQYIQTSSH